MELDAIIERLYKDRFLSKSESEQDALKVVYEKDGLLDDFDLFCEAVEVLFDELVDAAEYKEMYA